MVIPGRSAWRLVRLYTLRQWRKRPGRTALTLAAIAVGVALVMAVAVLTASIERSYTVLLSGLAGRASVQVTADSPTGFALEALEVVEQVPGVAVAAPVVRARALLMADEGEQLAILYGIDPAVDPAVRHYTLVRGRLPGTEDPAAPEIALTESVARQLGLDVGRPVDVLTATGTRTLGVVGLLAGEGVGLANAGAFAVMPLSAAQSLYLRGRRIDQIDVVPRAGHPAEELAAAIASALEDAGWGGLLVGSPIQSGREANQMLQGILDTLWLAAIIGGVTGAFMVFANMRRNVRERQAELAVVRALGASRRQIDDLVRLEAGILGLVATAIGIVLGQISARGLASALSANVLALYGFAATETPLTAAGVAMSVVAGVGASLVAAHVAARETQAREPAEALRGTLVDAGDEEVPGAPSARGWGLLLLGAVTAGALAWLGPQLHSHVGLVLVNGVAFVLAAGGLTSLLPVALGALGRRLARRPVRADPGLWRVGWTRLVRDRGRAGASGAGLLLAVGFMVTMHVYSASYKAGVLDWASRAIRWDLLVASSWAGIGSSVPLPEAFRYELESVPGVALAGPERFAMVRTLRADGSRGPMMWMIAFDWREAEAFTALDVVEGLRPPALYEALRRGEGVAISRLAANYTGLGVGDRLRVAAAEATVEFPVLAVVNDASPDLGVAYVDRALYRRHWPDDTADSFAVVLEPGVSPGDVRREIEARWGSLMHLQVFEGEAFRQQMRKMVDDSLRLTMGLVWLGLWAGAFGIGNAVVLGVEERRRELAILRAIGAEGRRVGRMVAAEGIVLGAVASALGVVLGLIGSAGLVRGASGVTGTTMSLVVPPSLAGYLALVVLVLVPLFCHLSGRLAAKMPLAESLRYE
ncbi:MAG TPA: ABC transporter permease [Limnochordales bacterium]